MEVAIPHLNITENKRKQEKEIKSGSSVRSDLDRASLGHDFIYTEAKQYQCIIANLFGAIRAVVQHMSCKFITHTCLSRDSRKK